MSDDLIRALRENTEAVEAFTTELKRQNDTAEAADAVTLKKYLGELPSGQIGGQGLVRGYKPGRGE